MIIGKNVLKKLDENRMVIMTRRMSHNYYKVPDEEAAEIIQDACREGGAEEILIALKKLLDMASFNINAASRKEFTDIIEKWSDLIG